MRVAIVLNTSWNIFNFRMGLLEALMAQGHEIHAVAPKDNYSPLLEKAGCIYHKVRMDSRGANPVKDALLIGELYFLYKKIKPDVVLHYTIKPNIYGTIAARLLKIPCINNVCGLGTVFLNNNIVSKIAKAMYKFAFRFPRKVFFQNQDDHDFFIQTGLVKESKTGIIPGSGINLSQFEPNGATTKGAAPKPVKTPAALPNAHEPFTFLMVSRLISDKGVMEYIDAIKMLKQEGVKARFQVLGSIDPKHKKGIPEETVRGWVNDGTIEYLGHVSDVRPFLNKANCVVLPSYREGTPRTLLEAAAVAKPIVATNVAGCTNVVEDGFNGLLCQLKDPVDLAEKMKKMASLPEDEITLMGKNGRKKVEREFDEQLVIDSYLHEISTL